MEGGCCPAALRTASSRATGDIPIGEVHMQPAALLRGAECPTWMNRNLGTQPVAGKLLPLLKMAAERGSETWGRWQKWRTLIPCLKSWILPPASWARGVLGGPF